MKNTEIAYLAGLVDGEGYVGIKKSAAVKGRRQTTGYHARIQVRMVDEPAIKFLAETLGGTYYKEKPHCNNGRPLYCFQASDKMAEGILKSLLPFLRVKRPQAELVLSFRELQSDSSKHRTKVTGHRWLPHWNGKKLRIPNRSFSDEYVALCESIWQSCRNLNGFARFQ